MGRHRVGKSCTEKDQTINKEGRKRDQRQKEEESTDTHKQKQKEGKEKKSEGAALLVVCRLVLCFPSS
jgi:hypothetical protein